MTMEPIDLRMIHDEDIKDIDTAIEREASLRADVGSLHAERDSMKTRIAELEGDARQYQAEYSSDVIRPKLRDCEALLRQKDAAIAELEATVELQATVERCRKLLGAVVSNEFTPVYCLVETCQHGKREDERCDECEAKADRRWQAEQDQRADLEERIHPGTLEMPDPMSAMPR